MKNLLTFFFLAFIMPAALAKQVPQQEAQQLAVKFYRLNNPIRISDPIIQSVTTISQENISTIFIFRFVSGGFVLVAADDASIPVLGYSFDNEMPEVIDNPAIKNWLDKYSCEIAYIINNKLDNGQTLQEWHSPQDIRLFSPNADVMPLLPTLWDQNCYYNALCPPEAFGECGHTYTGCMATAMAQVMKYHNFPPRGVGQHSYADGNYGQLSADFGDTDYDWASMPDSITSGNPSIATLMYHAGISLNMGYGNSTSAAYSEKTRDALINYFNYDPVIENKYLSSYANPEDFKTLLREDLNASLPVLYFGSGPYSGHEFVCDGYRMSDDKFHFNWGWSGYADGYYAIGNLNPAGMTFNTGDMVTLHIKPYNPSLIVRITNPADKVVESAGTSIEIKAKTLRGSSNAIKIFIDGSERSSSQGDSISFTWNTTTADLGSHIVKASAMNSTDTVYYKILINVVDASEWISQASGLSSPSQVVAFISAIDSSTAWACASDGNNAWSVSCSDFTRTTNGGANWTSGVITNTAGLAPSMIFAVDSLKAYVAMYNISGNDQPGIYATQNGGSTWTRQAAFNYSTPYPEVVHFFNANEGVCIGDPFSGKFVIYTTGNAGNTWTQVTGTSIPNPLSHETGMVGGFYSAVHDTLWFGTSLGRVFRSTDKGHHWTVSAPVSLSGKQVKPRFRNGFHGLLLDYSTGTGQLCETFDGGTTWTPIDYTGPREGDDIVWVPGTPNTWVKSSLIVGTTGCAYSFDGGHTWSDFIGTSGSPFAQMAWINDHCGWSGGVNTGATQNGVHKFVGSLAQLPSPQNVQATAVNHHVDISWNAPAYDPATMSLQGYSISRNGTLLNQALVSGLAYTDPDVSSGHYTYCVAAQYNMGASQGTCKTVDVAVGIVSTDEQPELMIYPNPAHQSVTIKSSGIIREITVYDQMGHALNVAIKSLSKDFSAVDVSDLAAGIYVVSIRSASWISKAKLVVY